MPRLFSLISYLWIPFMIMSRVGGTNAFHGYGLLRAIPTTYIFSSLLSQKHRTLFFPHTIVRTPERTSEANSLGFRGLYEDGLPSKDNVPEEDEPMDHGELEWDFPSEKTPTPPIIPDINSTIPFPFVLHPGMGRLFRMCIDDYVCFSYLYKEFDDPVQIIFLFL